MRHVDSWCNRGGSPRETFPEDSVVGYGSTRSSFEKSRPRVTFAQYLASCVGFGITRPAAGAGRGKEVL